MNFLRASGLHVLKPRQVGAEGSRGVGARQARRGIGGEIQSRSISSSMGEVRLEGHRPVSRLTKIDTGMGSVTIDLSQAEFDDWDIEVVVHTHMGDITVIVARGVEVRPVGRSGPVHASLEPPIPGFPVVRLSATCDMGTIRVMHPAEKKQRRRRWRRGRGKTTPRP